MGDKSPTCNPSTPWCLGFFCSPHETDRLGGSAKSRNRSFCVLRKSKTGNFSVVTLRVATLKIPGLVFFVSHQKYSTGTFGTAAHKELINRISEISDGNCANRVLPDACIGPVPTHAIAAVRWNLYQIFMVICLKSAFPDVDFLRTRPPAAAGARNRIGLAVFSHGFPQSFPFHRGQRREMDEGPEIFA